jgi:predicted O-methyltransferase YrrM
MATTRESIKFAAKLFDGKTTRIVEVGVGNGPNALDMYDKLSPDYMYLVDPFFPPNDWPASEMERARSECALNKQIVMDRFGKRNDFHIILKESHKAVDDVPNNLDLVYIDAVHDEFNVKRDIECWLPKIRVGGLICGHDWYDRRVKSAVMQKFNFKLSILSQDRYTWGTEGNDWWKIKE